MDYIRKFDIELDREYYYAGETLNGHVVIENSENLKVRGVRVSLRAKAHVEWKITRGGERKTVKEDQYFIDDKKIVWGKDKNDDGPIPILHRSMHKLPFSFQLPECALPCSFESRIGTIRYYLRVLIDIPYASPPQGLKYFTIIGPHLDCMEERYLAPVMMKEQNRRLCMCFCAGGPISLESTLERSGYVCGEHIRLKCEVQNGTDEAVWVTARLVQTVEYRINKSVLGLTKDVSHKVMEYNAPKVKPHDTRTFVDLHNNLRVPVLPPTLADVCKVIDIYYVLKVHLSLERSGSDLHQEFSLDIATVPFRVPTVAPPALQYAPCSPEAEGGMYTSPEFQLGQVYDGGPCDSEDGTVLYRPLYPTVTSSTEEVDVPDPDQAGTSSRI